MGRRNRHGLPKGLRKVGDRYRLDFYVDKGGRRVRVRQWLDVTTKAAAVRKRDEVMGRVATGAFFDDEPPEVSFEEAADAFLAYSRERRRSYRRDEQLLRPLREFFGGALLSAITEDDVYRYIRRRRASITCKGTAPADATINRELSNLKTILNRAVRAGHLDRSPMAGFKLLPEHNIRDRVLTGEEHGRLLDECPVWLCPIVRLAYRTGMRLREILELSWDQVDLRRGLIALRSGQTKTGEGRLVPLDAEMAEALRRLPRSLLHEQVFLRDGAPIRCIRSVFAGACRRAELEDFRFHDLRHCAVTNMARLGINEKTIMRITGHKTTHMLRRYQRVDETDLQQASTRVMEHLSSRETEVREVREDTVHWARVEVLPG